MASEKKSMTRVRCKAENDGPCDPCTCIVWGSKTNEGDGDCPLNFKGTDKKA